jgi:predicted nuclease of restriction endonuclease-like (RecB) superfamily
LATDLKNDIPQIKGFSERNLQLMIQFQDEYPDLFPIPQQAVAELSETPLGGEIRPRPVAELAPPTVEQVPAGEEEAQIAQRTVAQLPWAHNVILIQKVKDLPTRLWYARQVIAQGWSRDTLTAMIKSNAHKRQGVAVTNFDLRLPAPQSELAQAALKDPYLFDFMTLDQPFRERELEAGLIEHLERFLLELGAGFAFVGRQYHIDIAEEDFYIDLLFYHLRLRAFVVVDLKIGPFKPEYAGKMNFYCNVVDDRLRHTTDNPTIGLILCQDKKKVLAEYALRGMDKPIGVSEYELTRALPDELKSSLPTIEEIEEELEGSLKD